MCIGIPFVSWLGVWEVGGREADLESPVFAGSSWPELRESNCQQSLPTSLLKASEASLVGLSGRSAIKRYIFHSFCQLLLNYFLIK